MKIPVSAIILTYNEQINIEDCINSVIDLVDEIFVVDSYSTDQTIQLLQNYPVQIVQHPFENYSQQRNWAIENLPFKNEWILNLDADHRVNKDLADELIQLFKNPISDEINGFLVSRKTMFMGKWIKYGGQFPTYHAILFKKHHGYCEHKMYDQHFKVDGKLQTLKGTINDLITESISTFTLRHNKWSDFEAQEQIQKRKLLESDTIDGKLWGNAIERRRFFKNIYLNFPLFVRPLLYFLYRYIFKLGFLDGKRGLIFHFLQCFWFRFLIDCKIYEKTK